mmetsp:Transcript_16893/g.45099  ORF Transcript_16893/g.45099 Transcript_16893/m.45099 type:complete len:239 (-) Transcript_16893:80-796(-)
MQLRLSRLSTMYAPLYRNTKQSATLSEASRRWEPAAAAMHNADAVAVPASEAATVAAPSDAAAAVVAVAARRVKSSGGCTHCQHSAAPSLAMLTRGHVGSSHSQALIEQVSSPSATAGQNSSMHWKHGRASCVTSSLLIFGEAHVQSSAVHMPCCDVHWPTKSLGKTCPERQKARTKTIVAKPHVHSADQPSTMPPLPSFVAARRVIAVRQSAASERKRAHRARAIGQAGLRTAQRKL